MNRKFTRKKIGFLVPPFIILVLFFLFNINTAHAFSLNPFDWVESSVADFAQDSLVKGFKYLLYFVLVMVSWVISAANILFRWIMNPAAMGAEGFFDNDGVLSVWRAVRDLFNMFFILVLLYSAFCTVFQVDKYHIKNIYLKVIINALLVNFSLPIARFVIDISNVMMYYFLDTVSGGGGGGSGVFSSFAHLTKLSNILVPGGIESVAQYSVSYLIAAIILTFVLGMTLMVLSFMFLIRIIALVIIVMFSPIGFVGYIFPGTAKFADEWWSNLMKYAFFGPIMTFMLVVAFKVILAFSEVAKSPDTSLLATAAQDTSGGALPDANFFQSMAFFMVPIAVLWAGMMIAQKVGGGAGAKAVGTAKGIGRWAGRLPLRAGQGAFRATGVPDATKEMYEKGRKTGKFNAFGKTVNLGAVPGLNTDRSDENRNRRKGWITGGRQGAENAVESHRKKLALERADEMKKNPPLDSSVDRGLISGDEVERMAMALHVANNGMINDMDRLQKALSAVGRNSDFKNKILDKAEMGDIIESPDDLNAVLGHATVNMPPKDAERLKKGITSKVKKEGKVKILINHDVKYEGESPSEAYEKHLNKLSAEDFAKQKDLHENIADDENLKSYVSNMHPQRQQDTFEKMNGKDQRAYASAGFAPGQQQSSQGGETFQDGAGI